MQRHFDDQDGWRGRYRIGRGHDVDEWCYHSYVGQWWHSRRKWLARVFVRCGTGWVEWCDSARQRRGDGRHRRTCVPHGWLGHQRHRRLSRNRSGTLQACHGRRAGYRVGPEHCVLEWRDLHLVGQRGHGGQQWAARLFDGDVVVGQLWLDPHRQWRSDRWSWWRSTDQRRQWYERRWRHGCAVQRPLDDHDGWRGRHRVGRGHGVVEWRYLHHVGQRGFGGRLGPPCLLVRLGERGQLWLDLHR
mmetsp:Transcript_24879/g.83587  ORF Transcript_24879/g.83587 Transcript_24879/m.83587 type:complete len:245 (+) Transcript_24879:125-859(+)